MTDLADELTDADMLLMWQSGPHRDRSTGAGWFPNPLAGATPQEADSPFDPPADPAPRADDDAEPLAVLEGRITSMAARLAAKTREWLVLVAEFYRRKGWAGWGMRSMAHWLSYSCSVTPGVAREYVRVATALTGLPFSARGADLCLRSLTCHDDVHRFFGFNVGEVSDD